MMLLLRSMWRNFSPFPSILLNFPPHTVELYSVISHTYREIRQNLSNSPPPRLDLHLLSVLSLPSLDWWLLSRTTGRAAWRPWRRGRRSSSRYRGGNRPSLSGNELNRDSGTSWARLSLSGSELNRDSGTSLARLSSSGSELNRDSGTSWARPIRYFVSGTATQHYKETQFY